MASGMEELSGSWTMKRLRYYLNHWWQLAQRSWQETMVNRFTSLFFIVGKMFRMVFSLVFLWVLKNNLQNFASYTTDQLIVFYFVYFYIDLISQTFFRGVYWFGQQLRTGQFDFWLTKPVSPLFSALAGKPDINDALFFIPSAIISFFVISGLDITVSSTQLLWFLYLFVVGLVIATSIHIIILALAVQLIDIDGIMWLYRDIIRLGQFPVTIYQQGIKFILFFFVPVGIMMTVPSEVLLGYQPSVSIFWSTVIGIGSLFIAKVVWQLSLKKYTSASS